MVQGRRQLVPLVQHLGQAHVCHARMGCLAALAGRLQRLPVGRGCRVQVALGALHLAQVVADRSEEHTSELQSRRDLVCRLLLEKKKKQKKNKRNKKKKKKEKKKKKKKKKT